MTDADVIEELYEVIEDRRDDPREDSYTSSLMEDPDAALQKLGEETTEAVVAAKNDDADELVHEAADVVYHLLVVLAESGVELDDLLAELEDRRR